MFFLCMYKNLTHQQIYLRARLKSTGHLDRSTGDLLKGARPVASFLHDVGATKKKGFPARHGGFPNDGWFSGKSMHKWMMTGATPMA